MDTRGLLPRWPRLALAAVAALMLLGAACGGDDTGDPAEVEAAIVAAVDAWNGQDVEGFLEAFTDSELQRQFDAEREELRELLPELIGEPPITLGAFSGTRASGDIGSTTVVLFFGKVGTPERFKLLKEDGAWVIGSEDSVEGDVPDGVTAVDLSLTEYAFEFDASAISDGNFVFNMSNEGEEDHELVLWKVPPDLDIEEALQSEEEPAGVEEIGQAGPIKPRSRTAVLFSDTLAPGRYAMLCFVEDEEGTPHAELGMWAEFTVE